MELAELQRQTKQKSAQRIGRGGKRGKTSGRGHKGQKAHASSAPRPQVRDLIKKLPKLRGHGKNRAKTVNTGKAQPTTVNLAALNAAFDNGAEVTPHALVGKGLIKRRGGRVPAVKILGTGELTTKLSVSGCALSDSAREKIEKAGGTVGATNS